MPAVAVFENPVVEFLQQLLFLVDGALGIRFIQDAGHVPVATVINGNARVVQYGIEQIDGFGPLGAPFRRINGGCTWGADLKQIRERRKRDFGVTPQQVLHKIRIDVRRHPGGAHVRGHLVGCPWLGLHGLQRLDVRLHVGGDSSGQLLAHIAR